MTLHTLYKMCSRVRSDYDTNYFNDYWQGIPSDGYNALFDRLLDHPNIQIQCNCELCLEVGQVKVKGEGEQWINSLLSNSTPLHGLKIYYSGPIDALFNYKFGALPWRTLRFESETLNEVDYQGTSVVNYTDIDVPYTRIHEFKHYHPEGRWYSPSSESKTNTEVDNSTIHLQPSPSPKSWGFNAQKTIIMREYSAQWRPGDEPYYPINSPESAALLEKYQEEVEKFNRRCSPSPSTFTTLVIGGRLGQYKYFDMDKSVEAALEILI